MTPRQRLASHVDMMYHDSDGNRVDLAVLCRREPGWATNRIQELTRQVEALLRGNDQMRLLARLPLPPDVVDQLNETNRLREEINGLREELRRRDALLVSSQERLLALKTLVAQAGLGIDQDAGVEK